MWKTLLSLGVDVNSDLFDCLVEDGIGFHLLFDLLERVAVSYTHLGNDAGQALAAVLAADLVTFLDDAVFDAVGVQNARCLLYTSRCV